MIDGITILNQYLYTNITGVHAMVFAVILLAFFGIMFFDDNNIGGGFLCCIFAAAILVVAIIMGGVKLFNAHTLRYDVTIEDSVSFNDVMENYEIIGQNGQIWTIEVKEKEE